MDRRGFLSAILLAGCAPAVVKASSLMRIVRPSLIEAAEYSGLLTVSMITAEALRILESSIVECAATNVMYLNEFYKDWRLPATKITIPALYKPAPFMSPQFELVANG